MPRIAPSRRIPAQQLEALEARMQAYYAAVPDYPAFQEPSLHPREWAQVLTEVLRRPASQAPIAILEFGAGRSGFPAWVRQELSSGGSAISVAITCQDVTATNRTYLQQVADAVLTSSLHEGVLPPSSFDIIFSTHCFEHVARPEALLHTLIGLLKPGGSLLLFAPRYDLPLYLSPSASDLTAPQRLLLSLRLLAIRLLSRLRGTPSFVLDTRPACLDRPFRRDSDAIHWVSSHDFYLFARRAGLVISELDIRHHARPWSKQWLIDQFGKLAICLHKPQSSWR